MSNDIQQVINAVLDRVRQERNLTDDQLAAELGVEESTIWRWRCGQVGKSARILIPLITCTCHPNATDQAA